MNWAKFPIHQMTVDTLVIQEECMGSNSLLIMTEDSREKPSSSRI
jgi:hypothetical protein